MKVNIDKQSTRYKFKSLPKYVYLFQTGKSKKVFRICKKVDGKTKTLGYYKNLEDAIDVVGKLKQKGIL